MQVTKIIRANLYHILFLLCMIILLLSYMLPNRIDRLNQKINHIFIKPIIIFSQITSNPINYLGKSVLYITNLFQLKKQNLLLKTKIDKLYEIELQNQILQQENQELRQMFNIQSKEKKLIAVKLYYFKQTTQGQYAYLKVIQTKNTQKVNIKKHMFVVDANKKLLGRVMKNQNNLITVIPIHHKLSNIPIKFFQSKFFAIATGKGYGNQLKIKYLSKLKQPKLNEKVLTYGENNIITNNIYVGIVKKNQNGEFFIETSTQWGKNSFAFLLDSEEK